MVNQVRKKTVRQHSLPSRSIGMGEYLLMYGILYLFICCMVVIAKYDYSLTMWLNQHKWPQMTRFMGRTLFEDSSLGGSDFGILLLILSLVAYLVSWLSPKKIVSEPWRPYWGFILTSGLCTGIFMVHGLKWIVARARPSAVLEGSGSYTSWFEIGSYFIAEGSYRGSLPSGHTATTVFLITIAYILAGNRYNPLPVRFSGLLWGGCTFCFCLLMAICRPMAMSHWLGDCLFSLWMGWTIVHVLYFWVLRVPIQVQYFRRYGVHPSLPKLWELRLCSYFLILTLSLVAFVFGLRSIWLQSLPWISILILPGYLLLSCALRRCHGLLVRVHTSYAVLPDEKTTTIPSMLINPSLS